MTVIPIRASLCNCNSWFGREGLMWPCGYQHHEIAEIGLPDGVRRCGQIINWNRRFFAVLGELGGFAWGLLVVICLRFNIPALLSTDGWAGWARRSSNSVISAYEPVSTQSLNLDSLGTLNGHFWDQNWESKAIEWGDFEGYCCDNCRLPWSDPDPK